MIRVLSVYVVLAVLAAIPVTASSAAGAPTKLVARVGPGLTISLKTATGKDVTTIKAGTYVILVRDGSRSDNFSLLGRGGQQRKTTLPFIGQTKWQLRLERGSRYEYYSDGHRSSLKGAFRVI